MRVAIPVAREEREPAPARRLPSSRVLVLLLVVATAIVLWLDVLTGTAVTLVPLLIVLPAFVAGLGTVRQTVATACWVTLVVIGSSLKPPVNISDTVVAILLTALFGALSAAGCVWRIQRDTELDRLRSAAVALQRQILRPLPLLTDELLVDGLYEPLEEDRLVGGDIYEVVASPYGTRVLIGDVQGKGLPAIGAGFAALGAFRESAVREPTLTAVVEIVEEAVVRHNDFSVQTGDLERFVTALVINIDAGAGVQVINCGHVPPHLLHAGAARPVDLGTAEVPLGMAALAPGPRTVDWFDFPPGATLLLCTDGITETRDPDGAFYPLEERLPGWAGLSSPEMAAALRSDLERFSHGQKRDDIAVLMVRRAPGRAAEAEASAARSL